MKKKLLFVEGNTTGTGMLAICKAEKLGYQSVFLTQNANRYDGLNESGCHTIITDTDSIEDLKQCILQENVEEIAGILTTSDFYLETVAKLVQAFGLTGNTPQAIRLCRNKALYRETLSSEGVRQPGFTVVQSVEELQDIRKSVFLPCLVKPADGSGSNNVRLCFNWEEVEQMTMEILAKKHNARGQKTLQTVLLEEYIEGPEYSVEMFSWEGKSICVGITEKHVTGFPHFVESRHVFPSVLPAEVKQEIMQTVKRTLEAVDFQFGASHSEVKWTPDGCVMIETNARLAGGMIPELIRHSTGMDLLDWQIRCAAGVPPESNQFEQNRYSGIQFLMAQEEGRLSSVDNLESLLKLEGVQEVVIKAQVGQAVQPPKSFSDRLGYIIVSGTSYDEVTERLDQISDILSTKTLVMEPGV
ncbi:ATP-grasp domain-containing protein [Melghirimyces algeriensis]|uniref:Argininosuccinate lyase n=1 Tax=Melghirimyces algeriensis TaxID=910412 RepID=A0A521CXJ0_9BACL|nr:ATP-grasp domain-containing protein [Melghirimyces algeriensis]SMO63451.1 argininosuccinate lyase [Melghirimyces algeriensis]